MAEELRLALILLGSLAIGAVILHGIWTVRKTMSDERGTTQDNPPPISDKAEEEEVERAALKLQQMEMDFNTLQSSDKDDGLPVANVNMDAIYQADRQSASKVQKPLSSSSESIVEQIDGDVFEAKVEGIETLESNDSDLVSFSALDPIENVSVSEPQPQPQPQQPRNEETKKSVSAEPADVLMLFVDKTEGAPIEGAKLLPILLTLGFKFGDLSFFHRHQDSSGKGDVLFSLANMYNPGTFDIDHMEQMSTRGLTIFMTLPNAADPLQTFNMMHNAAKKIADEFDARVLDQNRLPLDVAIVRGYVERIRKFQG